MQITGVTHMHSLYSYDGKVSLRELKHRLVTAGHSFACMSEHTDELTTEQFTAFVQECDELSDERFIFIPGVEIPYGEAHILLLGCREWVGQQAADEAALRAASRKATLTILAHPVRNHFIVDEPMSDVLDGVEVWNQQYDGKVTLRPQSAELLATLRTQQPHLLATAGLDFHRIEHLGEPVLSLKVPQLTEAAVLTSLKEGHFQFGKQWSGRGELKVSRVEKVKSNLSIFVIKLGKKTNAVLASCGLSLPKGLKRLIRRFV